MATRCKSIAGQKVTLGPGDTIIEGSELLGGSAICNSIEEYPFKFMEMECVAGDDGATVIWPDTGNDLMRYDEGEIVPVGTALHKGCVLEKGVIKCAPYVTQDESTATGDDTKGNDGDDGEDGKGFCVGSGNVNLPSKEEKDFLADIMNFQLPDLQAWALSGFTAKVQEMTGKLNAALGKLSAEVDALVSKATLDPEDVCTPPVKAIIRQMQAVLKQLMKIMPILRQIIQIVKLINKIIKIAKKILKWTPPFIVPIVETLLAILNLGGLIDMVVSTLVKTIGKFTAILPTLQAQLMAILAQCAIDAGGQPPTDKEACEAAGGTWIDPDELKELEDMYNKMVAETQNLGMDENVGFCSITEYIDKKSCEDNGGVWTDLDTDTDLENLDTTALSDELSKQMEELERCFANPELNDYIRGF